MKNLSKLANVDHAGKITLDSESFGQALVGFTKSSAYRKDLRRAGNMQEKNGSKVIYVKYAGACGVPDVEEMTKYVTACYPGWKPNFGNADLDSKNRVIAIAIEKDEPRIALKNANEIPQGFKAIGSGLYKDASQNVWSLKKDDTGNLSLTRSAEEKPIIENQKTDVFKVAKEFKIGEPVRLHSGETGIIVSFDKVGSSVVKIDNEKKLRIVSSNMLFSQSEQQNIRNDAQNDLDKFYTEMINKDHTPDQDEVAFYKKLISDPVKA